MNETDELLFNEFLKESKKWIKEYSSEQTPDEDLQQECALVISEYIYKQSHKGKSKEDINSELKEACLKNLSELRRKDEANTAVSEKILRRVNRVNDAAKKFKEEYYIKPTPAELAKELKVTESYIIDTVQMSGYLIEDIDFETNL